MSQNTAIVVPPALMRRAVVAAAIGNALEWYDFGIYNYLAVTIGRVFFPSGSLAAQQIATLGTFAAAFLIRPVGAAFFGPLGDRIGRQRVLPVTMLMMAFGTFAIGLIPSHARIGMAAPMLLLLARLVQGFSTGGEYGGAMTFIAEYAPFRRRGFLGSWLEFGTCAGFVLAALIAATLTGLLSAAQLDDWGWRLPFLLAAPFGLVGLYIRARLEETPAFRVLAASRPERERPDMGGVLRQHWRALVLCMALVVVFNIPDFLVLSYMPSYLTGTLGVPENRSLVLTTLVLLLMMGLVPLAGKLTDRWGRRPVIRACCWLYLGLAVPCFWLVGQGGSLAILVGLGVLGVILSGLIGAMPGTLTALFPTGIRYGALAIAYNLAISIFGGTSLPINAKLVQLTGDPLVPGYYLMGSSAIGLIAVWRMRETAGTVLPGASLTVESKEEAEQMGLRPVLLGESVSDRPGASG